MRDLLGRNEISSLVEMRSGCSLFRFYFTHLLPLFQFFVGVKRAASKQLVGAFLASLPEYHPPPGTTSLGYRWG